MKERRPVAIAMLLLGLFLAGCGGGRARGEDALFGMWRSPRVEQGGRGVEYDLTLQRDHSFERICTSVGFAEEAAVTAAWQESGTWEFWEDKLTLVFADGAEAEEYRLADGRLVKVGSDGAAEYTKVV